MSSLNMALLSIMLLDAHMNLRTPNEEQPQVSFSEGFLPIYPELPTVHY